MTRERADPGQAERICAAASRIPLRRVATYGQVAAEADLPGRARLVGRTLAALPTGSPVPWHRVINAKGEISQRSGAGGEAQRVLLEGEGVEFDARGRVDLGRYRWEGA